MVPLQAIRDHIQAANVPGVKRVHGSIQLSVAIERGQFGADAYVTLQGRTAQPNTLMTSRVEQRVKARIAVVQVVRYAGDAIGEAQADSIETRSDALLGALVGWSSDAATFAPFVYISGKLLDFDGSNVVWADEFETEYFIRSV